MLCASYTAVSASRSAKDYPLGDFAMPAEVYARDLSAVPDMVPDSLPTRYDARSRGVVTPPKDQGACGSCWAFAAVGAMESHILLLSGDRSIDLSEQQQLSCNTAQYGCAGGWLWSVRFWEYTGPVGESCFRYTANAGTPCLHSCGEMGYRLVNYHTVPNATSEYKASCFLEGPSSLRFDVYTDFFEYWDHGSPGEVYRSSRGGLAGGHAVLIIGWDDLKGAFLCKNSWGQDEGPNRDGTFWIAYTGHSNDLHFGMVNFGVVTADPPLQSVYVDWRYTDPDADGSFERPYPSIARAVDRAADGGQVTISAGEYAERVLFDRRLSVVAIDGSVRIGADGGTGSGGGGSDGNATSPGTLRIEALRPGDDRTLRLTLVGEVGRRYVVLTSADLVTWTIFLNSVLESKEQTFTPPEKADRPMRFFKLLTR